MLEAFTQEVMTKDSKTVSTIRRRKGKQVALALQKIKEENPKLSPFSEKEVSSAEIEDKCYLFDDRVRFLYIFF